MHSTKFLIIFIPLLVIVSSKEQHAAADTSWKQRLVGFQ